MNIDREIAKLKQMTIGQLRRRHEEVFGEPARTGNRSYLWKRIAWRIQEQAFGGLSDRAKKRAEELANEADLRIRPPRNAFDPRPSSERAKTVARRFDSNGDARLPMPGAFVSRVYQGHRIDVKVLERGFEFDGKTYRTLSAIAKAVTGAHWNGFGFFGLAGKRGGE